MSRQVSGFVLATIAATVLLAAVTTAGGVGLWQDPQWELAPNPPDPDDTAATTATTAPPPVGEPDAPTFELPGWVEAIARVLIVASMIGLVIVSMFMGWQRRPRLRWHRRRGRGGDFEALPDVAAAVVDDAAEQRSALLSGAPRNAIVRCWLRLEGDVAAAGLRRDPADTSAEFTERVLTRYSVDSAAIRDLAALYREARFSEHPIDETDREAAIDALDRLHAELGGSPTPRPA